MQIPEGMTPDQAAALHFQMQAIQPVLPTPEKKWYDRVVDSILGDDPCKLPRQSRSLVYDSDNRFSSSAAIEIRTSMRRMFQT